MKKIILLLSLCCLSSLIFAQDIDYLDRVHYWKDSRRSGASYEIGVRAASKYDVRFRILVGKDSPALRINQIIGFDKSGCLNAVLIGGQSKECIVAFANPDKNGNIRAYIDWVNVDDSNASYGSFHYRLVEKR